MALFVVVVHHGGVFVDEPNFRYVSENMDHFFDYDSESWSLFKCINLVESLGYAANYFTLWGRDPTMQVGGYNILESNDDVEALTSLLSDGMPFEVFVEHEVDDGLSDDESFNLDNYCGLEGDNTGDFETEECRLVKLSDRNKNDVGKSGNCRELEVDIGSDIDIDSEELHSLDDSSDSDQRCKSKTKFPSFKQNMEENSMTNFEIGMLFNSLSEFKDAVNTYAVKGGWGIRFVKNDKIRVRAKCVVGCTWLAYTSKVQGQETFQLKTYVNEHTCSRCFRNPRLTSTWLSKRLENEIKDHPEMKLTSIQKKAEREYISKISKGKAYRAKRLALDKVRGSYAQQYDQLWEYCNELRTSNPGTTAIVKLKVSEEDEDDGEHIGRIRLVHRFERFYICLDACKKGFMAGCRPFIGLDACHLKGLYGGQLIAAIGRDPNDQFYPLAFAVVEAETKDSWTWFLSLLIEDLGFGDIGCCTFISDRQKGLVPTFNEIIPNYEHRYCVRHLYSNMRKKYPGKHLKEIMWRAAKATYLRQWEREMDEMKKLDEGAYRWLKAIEPKLWSKHAFNTQSKCDCVVNNMCEAFNATILEARDQPILSLCEWIRNYLMRRFQRNRDKMNNFNGDVCPKIQKKIEAEKVRSGGWLSTWAGNSKFEVERGCEKFSVDLETKLCTCRKWELTGLPCAHAISSIFYKGDKVELYIDDCYKKSSYASCYDPLVYPVNGTNLWMPTNNSIIKPPEFRRPPGRPKKLRRREIDEPRQGTTVGKRHMTIKCSKCNKHGHNRRSCKGPVHIDNSSMGNTSTQ